MISHKHQIESIMKKIRGRDFKIGVIGVGYVGINLVLEFANKNFKIYCFDKDFDKLKKIRSGISPFSYINNDKFSKLKKKIVINRDFKKIADCDAIIICLPTPLRYNKPDLSQIIETWDKIKKYIRKYQLLILESTTYPGTTEQIFLTNLKSRFTIDKDIFLSYSPERENPGDNKFSFNQIPKVVSGIGINSKYLSGNLYSKIIKKLFM